MTTLDRLPIGAHAVIDHVDDADGADHTLLRLREMGMTPQAPVAVTRRGPFGDPLEVEIRGTRLCLRHVHAARFRLRPDDEAGARG